MPATRILVILLFALVGPACASAGSPQSEWPAGLRSIGDGYPAVGAPCRRVGESDVTRTYLDDSADLVGCPTDESARKLNGHVVAVIGGITLVSIPQGSGVSPTLTDALIKACLAGVASEGTIVDGVDHVQAFGETTEVYVRVRGAHALWLCVGDRNGRVIRVEYTETEGEL